MPAHMTATAWRQGCINALICGVGVVVCLAVLAVAVSFLRNVPKQVLRDSATFSNMEKQAHRFASAFLLHARTFRREWITPDIQSFKGIKLKWKSAISAMIMRAADLGILSDSKREYLMITLGRKGWRQREPFDDDFEPEIPRFFSRACQMVAAESILSTGEMLTDIGLERADVESILGLPNFFEQDPAPGV